MDDLKTQKMGDEEKVQTQLELLAIDIVDNDGDVSSEYGKDLNDAIRKERKRREGIALENKGKRET